MALLDRLRRLLGRREAEQQPMEPRQRMLYDLLRNARKVALPEVPQPLQREFAGWILSDTILEVSSRHLMTGFRRSRQNMDAQSNPWQHNDYVAIYLRGLLQWNGFDERIRSHHGDPEHIATVMAEQIALVAFWLPRNN